jgi:hypothetical protein
MAGDKNTHDAGAAATGYLFQCRYALLAGIQQIADFPQLAISLEKFDDVAFDAQGEPVQLIQTKHHIAKTGSLSDASLDLWKTLHIWTKLVAKDVEAPFRMRFVLLTTSTAPDGSAAALLRVRNRDELEADKRLLTAATSSTNEASASARDGYKALPEDQRRNLLKAVVVLDGSPNIIDVHDEICRELQHAVPRNHVEHFVERLEGWWFGIVVKALAGVAPTSIPVLAIDNRIDELREEFQRAALPVDFATQTPPPAVVAELDKRPFVRQLRRIEVGTLRVEYAIRDYYRASEQRSKWAREDLLVDGELEKYERELVEAWQPRFAAIVEELPPSCEPRMKIAAGQSLFKWVETEAIFPLRTVRHRFLTHGSYHILSNRDALGWHPDYAIADTENGEKG